MAKGQMRSNRETRKPKQEKAPVRVESTFANQKKDAKKAAWRAASTRDEAKRKRAKRPRTIYQASVLDNIPNLRRSSSDELFSSNLSLRLPAFPH